MGGAAGALVFAATADCCVVCAALNDISPDPRQTIVAKCFALNMGVFLFIFSRERLRCKGAALGFGVASRFEWLSASVFAVGIADSFFFYCQSLGGFNFCLRFKP